MSFRPQPRPPLDRAERAGLDLALRELIESRDPDITVGRRAALTGWWIIRWCGFMIPILAPLMWWQVPSSNWPIVLLCTHLGIGLCCCGFSIWFRTQPEFDPERIMSFLIGLSALIGVEFGLMLQPALGSSEPERNIILCMLFMAVSCSLSAISLSMVPRCVHAFNLTAMTIYIVQLVTRPVAFNLWMSLGLFLVIVTMTIITSQLHDMLHAALEGRIAQSELTDQLAEAMERLDILAATDELTGLCNRRRFISHLEERLTRDEGDNGCLILFDLDHFKQVNDTYGHQVGDLVLQGVSKVAQATLRRGDVIGRIGGEEFAVLCATKSIAEARLVAQRIRGEIEQLIVDNIPNQRVTASFGVLPLSRSASVIDSLTAVDVALYQAKDQGRNRVLIAQLPQVDEAPAGAFLADNSINR